MKKRSIVATLSSILLLMTLMALITTVSTSCSTPVATLNVYNWGQYISDGSEGTLDVNKEFEKWYYETYGEKIAVNYATFASNEDMYAKLKSGAVSYDVIIPSDYMIEQLISEGLLEKIDLANIPNFSYILDSFKNPEYDPQNEYSVPYTYGMVGIIYNTTLVNGAPTSWSLLWDDTYSGQILNFNNPRDAFGTAMYKLKVDVNTTEPALWDAALSTLKEQKPLVQAYVMDEIFNKMANGSAAIAPYYAGDFFTMYADNPDLAFYYPDEGTNYFVDAMCIPTGTQNKELAEMYINFMLREDIAVANAEYICYASPNTLVRQNTEYREYLSELHPDAEAILYPEDQPDYDENYLTSYYKHLDPETRRLMNERWEQLKINSNLGVGIYIACAAVLIILVIVIVIIVKKRKSRSDYGDLYNDEDSDDDDSEADERAEKKRKRAEKKARRAAKRAKRKERKAKKIARKKKREAKKLKKANKNASEEE